MPLDAPVSLETLAAVTEQQAGTPGRTGTLQEGWNSWPSMARRRSVSGI